MPKKQAEPVNEEQPLAVVHDTTSVLATVEQLPQAHQLARLTMTDAQITTIQAPIDIEEIEWRWADKEQTHALAYAPQYAARLRLCKAFPGRWCLVEHEIKRDGQNVVYHGSLYIDGCFISSAYGEQEYQEQNQNTTWATAVEGAKSDCLKRCCKDLGMFMELYNRKFTAPLEKAWVAANKQMCPKCSKAMRKSDTEFYCWRAKGGCGYTIPLEDTGAAVAAPPADVLPQDKRQSPTPSAGPVATEAEPPPQQPRPVPTAEKWGLPSNKKVEEPKEDPVVLAALLAEVATLLNDKLFSDGDRQATRAAMKKQPKFTTVILDATKLRDNLVKQLAIKKAAQEAEIKAKRETAASPGLSDDDLDSLPF